MHGTNEGIRLDADINQSHILYPNYKQVLNYEVCIKRIQDIIPATATHCILCHPPQQSLLSVEYTMLFGICIDGCINSVERSSRGLELVFALNKKFEDGIKN